MSKATLYNYNPTAPTQITREQYTGVGAGNNIVGDVRRAFKVGTDFEIWDAAIAGNQLTENVDYELIDPDDILTADAGFAVYSGYKILNPVYQAGNIFITYKIIMSYNDAITVNTLIADLDAAEVDIDNLEDYTALLQRKNFIINPDGEVSQRGASGSAVFTSTSIYPNNDDAYCFDRWVLLSDGNDIVDLSQVAASYSGSNLCMKFEVETQNKKFGHVQIIQSEDSKKLANKYVTVRFSAKTEAGKVIENLRCIVLTWSGAADAVTSDVVSAWNAEGANPTFAANWTAENVAVNIPITNSWAKYTIDNIYLDSATINNVALFIWVDDTDAAVNDLLYLCQVELVISDGTSTKSWNYIPRKFEDEVELCQGRFCKSYILQDAPGTITTAGNFFQAAYDTSVLTGNMIFFPTRMMGIPTITWYSDATGTASRWSRFFVGDIVTNTNGLNIGETHFSSSQNAILVAANYYSFHYVADAEL